MFERQRPTVTCNRLTGFLLYVFLLAPGALANQALLDAAHQGDLVVVRAQLASGADIEFTLPNDTPQWGYRVYTPLEAAAIKGHAEVVAVLLQQGAATRSDQWYGMYAATWAGGGGHVETLALLLDHKKITSENADYLFGPALISAASNRHLPATVLLLEHGIDPNWHTPGDAHPEPAVLRAARSGGEAVFLAVLDAGADPTPYPDILAYAASRGDAKMVDRLLQMGMDANADGGYGQPLALAACTAQAPPLEHQQALTATAELLLSAGSDVNTPVYGRSPLFCAREYGNTSLAALLQEHDAEAFETVGRKLKRAAWMGIFSIGDH